MAPVALVLPLLAGGCAAQTADAPDPVRPVKTMVVASGGELHMRSFPGKIEASRKVELAFRVSGVLVNLPVVEKQKVAQGELIAQLRQDEFEARLKTLKGQLDQARARLRAVRSGERPEQQLRLEAQVRAKDAKLANARTDYARAAQLVRSRTLAPADYDRAATALRVATQEHAAAVQALEKGAVGRDEDIEAKEGEVRSLEGRVAEAKIQLDDSTLRAPYDGVIAKRFVEQSQNIKAMEPVVRFQDVDELDVLVDVPESVMADSGIRAADIVKLVAEFPGAPGQQFPVRIREVAQAADPETQTFRVRVALLAPEGVRLLPGMTATVTVTSRRASVLDAPLLVPIGAVTRDAGGRQVVWVLGPGQKVTPRPVKLGEATGGEIAIISGLEPGDRIAVAGATLLRDGMKVRDLGDALGGD
jgi:RND family efflux transporter MFP subunit